MESTPNGNEYTLMKEYDFSKSINVTITFDSDEDELDTETNTLLPEKYDSDHDKVTKYRDMPSLDEQNSKAKLKLDDVVTGMIEKYMNEPKKTGDTISPKRKSSTTSNNTIKNKLKKSNNMKELEDQHNEPSSSSSNTDKNFPLASLSAEPSGPQSNVSNDIICKTKKTYYKKPPNRKPSTTSNDTIKNTNNVKELEEQHNEPSSSSSNNDKNCPLASFPTEPSEPPRNVSNDIRSQNSSRTSSSPSNEQLMISASIEPKAEPIEDLGLSNYLSKENNNKQNTSTSSSTNNSQVVSSSEDKPIQPIRQSWTSSNIAFEGIGNTLDNSTSNSSPINAYNGQPIFACIEVKTDTKDSIPQINVSYEITSQQNIFSTSNLPTNTDQQRISACIEQRVKAVEHPLTSTNDVSKEIRNGINNKIGDQSNISISILPPNADTSCTLTNVSEEIRNPLNTSGFSPPTNTNNILVSTNATSNIQRQQNNDHSVTYAHLKPLLDTVSEHLILIWKKWHVLKEKCAQNMDNYEVMRILFNDYKVIKLFDLSYSTVVNVILPRKSDSTFIKDFIANTAALAISTNEETSSDHIFRQTFQEIYDLLRKMIGWATKIKQQIAFESVFESEIMRQPLASTGTNKNINPQSTHNPETQRPPPWHARSIPPSPYINNAPPPSVYTNNPHPPYTYNLPQSYTNNLPQSYTNNLPQSYTNNPPPPYTNNPPPPYTNSIPPQYNNMMQLQSYVNNAITPKQTKAKSSTHNKHQQLSTHLMQKKKRFNKRQQVTVAEVERRVVNLAEGPRQDFHSANVTQVNNSNNKHQQQQPNVVLNHTGGTYQHYPPTSFTAVPNTNPAQSAHYINNIISANNTSYPSTAAEPDYQKLAHSLKSRIIPNNSSSSQNYYNRGNDASSQGINNYPNNSCLNQANNIQQESDRSSISRDSGFYSPRDSEEPSKSPLITHVTSLNPDAVNIIKGNCSVCGRNTNLTCLGCYATYYCSYECQNSDWRDHMTSCNNSQELRKLLSK